MRTIFRAAIALFSIARISPAMAGDGEGLVANTQFTQLPGVIAQLPAQKAQVAMVTQDAAHSGTYVTQFSHTTSLFPPHEGGGDNE